MFNDLEECNERNNNLTKTYRRLVGRYEHRGEQLREAARDIERLKAVIQEQHESSVTTLLDLTAQIDCYRERLGEELSYN